MNPASDNSSLSAERRAAGFFLRTLKWFILGSLIFAVGFVGLGLFLRNFKPEQAVREKPVANNIGEKASTQIPKLTHYGRNTDFSFIALLTFPEDQKTYVPCSRISIRGEEPPLRPGMTCDFLYHTYTDRQMETIPGGIEFIEEENRLILNDFDGKDYILIAEDMGTDLTVELKGASALSALYAHNGGLRLTGSGSLTIDDPMENYEMAGITVVSNDPAYLILENTISLSVTARSQDLIMVRSKQTGLSLNFYYLAPLRMSDNKSTERLKYNADKNSFTEAYIVNAHAAETDPDTGKSLFLPDTVTFTRP